MANAMTKTTQVAALIESKKSEIAKVLPDGTSVDSWAKLATVAFTDPDLASCAPVSIYRSLLQAGNCGLDVNPLANEAHFIKRGDQCTLMEGFRGMIKMARRSGDIQDIYADVVHQNDEFIVTKGTGTPSIQHTYAREERGAPTHVYAVALYENGYARFEVMEWQEVVQISTNTPAWKKYFKEMAKKTVLKRMCKTLPSCPELTKAMAIEDRAEEGKFTDPEIDTLDNIIEATVVVAEQDDVVPDIPKEETTLKGRMKAQLDKADKPAIPDGPMLWDLPENERGPVPSAGQCNGRGGPNG